MRTALAIALVATAGLLTPSSGGSPPVVVPTAAVPGGFTDRVEISGLTLPTNVSFAPDGRVFVAEKSGLIKLYDSLDDPTATIFADLRTQVINFIDRGLLSMALDPQFPTRPYVYVLYSYDAEPGGTAPRWNDGCPTPPGATTEGCVVQGRLSRLTVSGNQMVAEQPLVTGWCQQFPSHSVGTVQFGPDGALYASAGDGASYGYSDFGQAKNRCGDPPLAAGLALSPPAAEGGALRSQSVRRPAGQPVVLNGSIIRVDPDTGTGLPGNPMYASADQNARRIIAHGLRQPFRFGLRPGTEELWQGEVGWDDWEEINRVADINDGVMENFGWPCYEGAGRQGVFDAANLTRCESLYSGSGQTAPYYAYNHDAKVVASDACTPGSSALSGIAFEDGSNYPAAYDGALFFSDNARECIWVMRRGGGADPNPAQVAPFASAAGSVAQLISGPGGDIFYLDIAAGALHRIVYNGANHPPTAVVSWQPSSGTAPLAVQFDGRDSNDLDAGDSLTYAWDLDGDGAFDDSATAVANRTFTANGTYAVRLRVTDESGAFDTEAATVLVGPPNTPPTPVIDTPTGAGNWKVGDTISFSGHAGDAEEGALPADRLSWSLIINHCPANCHIHPMQEFAGTASGSFPAPDHEYPMSLSLVLTATDDAGARASTSVQLNPQTVDVVLQSIPAGLQLSIGSVTAPSPVTRRVIVGSTNSVSAPAQLAGGSVQAFQSWSDGGSATHSLAPASSTPTTYTATFRQVQAGCPATPNQYYTAPTPTGPPAVANLPDGRLAFSTLGADGRIYVAATDLEPAPLAAGPLECYGGRATDVPAVAAAGGSTTLFVRGTDNRIWQRTLTAGNDGAWSALPIGGTTSTGPTALTTPDGVVHLAVRGTNGAVFHAARRGGTWTPWESLGGNIIGTPALAPRPGGGLLVVARGSNDEVFNRGGDTGAWGPWSSLGGFTKSNPTVAAGFDGNRIDVFITGRTGGLWQRTYRGYWGAWANRDTTVPATARLASAATPNRMVVYTWVAGATAYRQYALGWLNGTAPYTCATCVPPPGQTGTVR